MRYSHWDIHSAVNHSGGCVALDQITYRSPSCTLLLQRGRQPPGRPLYIWALCPSTVLASFLISSSSSPCFTLLSSPPYLLWYTSLISPPPLVHSLSIPPDPPPSAPPLSFSMHLSISSLCPICLARLLWCPPWAFCGCGKSRGKERGSRDAR